jgi:Tfp pilus assembly protein PilO
MKISQRELMLGGATLGCLLFGLMWYIVDSNFETWQSKKDEIETLKKKIKLDETRIAMQSEWKADLDELQKDLRIFDTKQKSVSPELMKTIKNISNQNGLDIVRSQPHAEKPTGDLYEIGINCTWEGSLDAMVGFLTELQQQGTKYDVRTLNISPVGKNTGKLKGNMVIHCAYTRKPGGSAKPAGNKN